MSLNSAKSVAVSCSPGLATCCTTTLGSVGKPKRSEATSTHHSSPFLASNSNRSTSAAGKKLPAMSHGSEIFWAWGRSLLGSLSAVPACTASPGGGQENELTGAVDACDATGAA